MPRVAVRGPDGKTLSIEEKDLPQAIRAGAKVVSGEELGKAQDERIYGGAVGQAGAFSMGLLRGGAGPVGDVISRGILGDDAAKLKEHNPISFGGGELTGLVGTSVAGVGMGGAVAKAGNLARGAFGAAEASTVLGRVGMAALRSGAQGAVEGSILGATSELGDQILKGHDVHAQNILAAGMQGGLFGGAAGTGLGTLGALGGEAVRGIRGVRPISNTLDDVSGEMFLRSAGAKQSQVLSASERFESAAEMGKWGRDNLAKFSPTGSIKGREELLAAAQEARRKTGAEIGSVLRQADDAAIKAGAPARDMEEFLSVLDRQAAIAETSSMRGDLWAAQLRRTKDRVRTILNAHAEVAEGAGAPVIRSIRMPEEIAAATAANDAAMGAQKIAAGLGHPFRDAPSLVAAPSAVPAVAREIPANAKVSLDAMHKIRVMIDDEIVGKSGQMPAELHDFKDQLFKLRQAIEKDIEGGVGASLGEKGLSQYKSAKGDYARAKWWDQAATTGLARENANNAVFLGDKIFGGAGAVGGAIYGAVTGDPIEVLKGAVLGGLGPAMINHAMSSSGGQIFMSNALKSLARAGAVEKASASVGSRITDGVRAFLTDTPRRVEKMRETPTKLPREQLMREAKQARELAQNPEMMQQHIRNTVGVFQANRALGAAIEARAVLAMQALASKAPSGRKNMLSPTPWLERERISDAELLKFKRFRDGVQSPLSLLDDMKAGKVSREKVEAVKAVYPDVFQAVQSALIEHVQTSKKAMPYDKRVTMSMLFDVPLDETLTPEFISKMQQSAAGQADMAQKAQDAAPDQTREMGGRRPFEADSSMFQTSAEAVEAR